MPDEPPLTTVDKADCEVLIASLAAVTRLGERIDSLLENQALTSERQTFVEYLMIVGRFLEEVDMSDRRGPLIRMVGYLEGLEAGIKSPALTAKRVETKPPLSEVKLLDRAFVAAILDRRFQETGDLEQAAQWVSQRVSKWPIAADVRALGDRSPDVAVAIMNWRNQVTSKGASKLARKIYDELRRDNARSAEQLIDDEARRFGVPRMNLTSPTVF